MNASDISRFLLQPRKHYVDAMEQQGRVVTDADRNEGAALDDEDQRRVLRDLIGPTGSPDQGFAVDLQVGDAMIPQPVSYNGQAAVDVLPYTLLPGALYVEGRRYEHLGDVVALQPEYLQMTADTAPLANPGETHSQFVYLSATEQWVTSIEDAEFHEVALGQVDTATRVRRMARAEVSEVENGQSCEDAWNAVRDGIEASTGGTFNASGTQLQSPARLRLTLVPGEALDPCAPCSPDDPGRYLGAENTALRIMMAAPDRYVFAPDNAAGIYRVRLTPEDGTIPVEMLTLPRDATRWPLRNTVVEVMPWAAVLDQGEKVADAGVFLRVSEGFDPETSRFGLDAADLPALAALTRQWDDAHPNRAFLPNDNDADGDYVFVRFWHRLENDDDPVLLDTAGPHTLLNTLGIEPVFDGAGIVRDFWIATLRPNTPRTVVPWDLTQAGGVPPHGPERMFAPLSMLTFRPPEPGEPENAEVVDTVQDCRARFNPLVDGDGCCTHSVGDGVTSVGDYTSIQTAIDNLPSGGGKVCLLPGVYDEEVRIDRDDVILEGCGFQSIMRSPLAEDPAPGVIYVTGSRVTLRDLTLETVAQVGVQINEPDGDADSVVSDQHLDGLTVLADQREGEGGQTRSGIDIRNARNVMVTGCEVHLDGSLTDDAALFAQGEDITILDCRIESLPDTGDSSAWAGIQLGGGSRRTHLDRNVIRGGVGHGITLGSLVWTSETSTSTSTTGFGAGTGLLNPIDPCAPSFSVVRPVTVEEIRYDASSAGDLEDIRITDNRIEDMSANGISVLTLLPLDEEEGQGDLITTDRITIERNRIRNCVDQSNRLRDLAPAPKVKKLDEGEAELGGQFTVSDTRDAGLFLVEGEGIHVIGNEIRDNGTGDPNPIAGVSILYGDRIVIEDNRIRNNGLQQSGGIPSADGTGAGIFVSLAGVASNTATQDQADPFGFSLRVQGNVVDHPNGPALAARATGPVSVVGNHLFSNGSNAVAQEAGKAACVAITNLGAPAEATDLPAGEPSEDRWLMPDGTPEYLQRDTDPPGAEPRIGPGGRILFSRNQVTLRWVSPSDVGTGLQAGFSVALCTQDSVECTSNQFSLNVEDPGTKKSGDTVFARQPRMSAHVVTVGATANFSRNRIAEGVNDALISHLTLGGFLASGTDNLSTHLGFVSTLRSFEAGTSNPPSGDPQYRVDRGNLVLLTPVEETSGSTLVSLATVRSTANQLFSAFAEGCLGVDQGTEFRFDLIAILGILPRDG
ncbi:DUF6519 domain-containing protein [Tateyamaria armeniaca]|uniref:DUF6519 domain-containing protein n=1 Tax=Tateyamaria armeniaca TaxID=2518930 RepID=A0ABW8UVY5_9RHOB